MWSYAWTPIIFIVSYFSCTHHEKPRTLLGQKQKGRELLVVPKLNQKSRNLACREWGYYHYCYYFDEFTRHTHLYTSANKPPSHHPLSNCCFVFLGQKSLVWVRQFAGSLGFPNSDEAHKQTHRAAEKAREVASIYTIQTQTTDKRRVWLCARTFSSTTTTTATNIRKNERANNNCRVWRCK